MPFVAIVGAGELGASIARTIATRGRVAEVRLIDEAADIAAGKALDIQQAAPIEGSPTRLTAARDVTAAVGAAAIVLADRADRSPSTEWSGEAGLALVRRLTAIDRQAVIVCPGVDQHGLLTHGLQELRIPRTRLFGSAPGAVLGALRALVALEADISPAEVALTILGRVPDRIVVLWSEATIAGRPLARVLDASRLARIQRRVAVAGAPGPYALAAAAGRVAEMLVHGSRRIACCTIGLEGEFGIRRSVSSAPVVIEPGGIARVIAPALDSRDQVLVENALNP
jgi:malate/lactate dehydrogenase